AAPEPVRRREHRVLRVGRAERREVAAVPGRDLRVEDGGRFARGVVLGHGRRGEQQKGQQVRLHGASGDGAADHSRSRIGRSGGPCMRVAAALAVVVISCAPGPAHAQGAAPKPRPPIAGLEKMSAEFTELVERVAPSVVRIETKGLATAQAASGTVVTRSRGTGSGVIVDPEGYVVTNAHVVEGADHVDVYLFVPRVPGGSILQPRSRVLTAHLVGVDRETDVAVLRIEGKGLPALAFADYDGVRQGQMVFA